MITNELVGPPARFTSYPAPQLALEQGFRITAMKRMNADRERVFNAFTVPEYIETWFSAPGALAGRTVVWSRDNFLSISYSCEQSAQSRILCSYKVCRRSKLLFTWTRDNAFAGSSSLVKVRLEEEFGRTAVHVIHFGLELSNRLWHQVLWESSLEKMSKLF